MAGFVFSLTGHPSLTGAAIGPKRGIRRAVCIGPYGSLVAAFRRRWSATHLDSARAARPSSLYSGAGTNPRNDTNNFP